MDDKFAWQICGCIFFLMVVVAVWLVARYSSLRSYYYKNHNSLDYVLGLFAFKNKYKYDSEPQFYSIIMEKMIKFLNIDHYFTAHELVGYNQDTGKFVCFLTRTSRNSFFNSSLNRVKLRLSSGYFQKNFTGLVFSYEYIAGFASNFVLFASRDPLYYDHDGHLEYKFLRNVNQYHYVEEDIWALNGDKLKSKAYKVLFKNFARLYHDRLAGDCTVIVVFDNCRLNILLSDDHLNDAKKVEDNLQVERAKVDEIVKFFKWMKQSSSERRRSKNHSHRHHAFVEIRRNDQQTAQEQKPKKAKPKDKAAKDKDKKPDKKVKTNKQQSTKDKKTAKTKKPAAAKKKTDKKAIVKVEEKPKAIQKTKAKPEPETKAKPKTSQAKTQKKDPVKDVKKTTAPKTSKTTVAKETTNTQKSQSKSSEKKSSSSAAETVKMRPVEKIVKEEVPKTTMEPVVKTPVAEPKIKPKLAPKRKRRGRVKPKLAPKRKRRGRVKPKHSHASIKKAQKQAMRQKKR